MSAKGDFSIQPPSTITKMARGFFKMLNHDKDVSIQAGIMGSNHTKNTVTYFRCYKGYFRYLPGIYPGNL